MARNIKRSVNKWSSERLPGAQEAIPVPAEVASYLSQIRALIVAGNATLASKSLDNFRVRFGEQWFDMSEIKEVEIQIRRMKGLPDT